jgi:hypothetical protein
VAKVREELKIKRVLVALTLLEADLIRRLRKHRYGEGTFKMKDGQPYQVLFEESCILDPDQGLNITGSVVITPGREDDIINKIVKTGSNGKK